MQYMGTRRRVDYEIHSFEGCLPLSGAADVPYEDLFYRCAQSATMSSGGRADGVAALRKSLSQSTTYESRGSRYQYPLQPEFSPPAPCCTRQMIAAFAAKSRYHLRKGVAQESMVQVQPMSAEEAADSATVSVGVSIVLYRTRVAEVEALVGQLLDQGVSLVYLIDNSPKSFDAFADWKPPPRVLTISTRRNLGYGRANNLAIRDSVRRHKYHLVCNPDITLRSGTIPRLYALLEGRPEVGLCGPRVVGTNGQLQYLCKRVPSPADLAIRRFTPESWFVKQRAHYEMRDHSYDAPMEPPFISGCFMFFRSAVLQRLDGFDERYFLYLEDLDLSRRAAQEARNLYFPGCEVVHVHHRGAHKSLRLLGYFGASLVKYFNKWGWFERAWVARAPAGRD